MQGRTEPCEHKHILFDTEDITVGAVVMAQIKSENYTGTVLDLL